ncbi:putative pyridoxal-dependent decarboxylase domain-containing protein 2 [Haliotis asinina]|uniref:putative pyridoxal-dependent decarboxylase domain-containing protein 2 n=1 Tax=Haliotis asinina TaxID=109174 RepID=UPI00353224B1
MADSSSATENSKVQQAPDSKSTDVPTMERSAEVPEKPKSKGFLDRLDESSRYAERKFQGGFMSPMLAELERNVAKSNEVLDRINQKMDEDRQERIKSRLTSHIPEAMKGGGQKIEDILKAVEELILYGDSDTAKDREVLLQKLDDHGQVAVMAHSLTAYVSTLDEEHLKKFTARITSDCQLWLSRLFRFEDSSVVYHEDPRDGLVKICRLALYQKYPKYATEGFEALYSRPPVIYISAASRPGLGHYLCLQLGLPLSCICTVPCNTMFGSSSKMDVAMLEKLIQDDIAAAKTPVLLVAFAGTPVVGHVDKLGRLQEICQANSIWLHVEGNNLATLTMFSVPTSVQSAKSGDSLTINVSNWLGIPALPHATLYKSTDPTLDHAAGLNTFVSELKLSCLPLWICLQSLGHDGIVARVKHSCDLGKTLTELLGDISTIKHVNLEKKEAKRTVRSFGELISQAISALVVFEIVTPTIVFRYCEDSTAAGSVVAPYAVNGEDKQEEDQEAVYYDALNTWLAETLQTSCPKVPVQAVEVDKEGVCIRYAPLETAQVRGTSEEDVKQFVVCMKENLSVLDATCLQRKRFRSIVASHNNLALVDIDNWAGLGAVRFIPEVWINKMGDLPENGKNEVNNLNSELVHKLKAMDTAFSTGHTDDDSVCVRFGLITESTDIEELVSLVYTTGKEVEESSKFLESMSEMIMKGIEEANKELQKETEEKLVQEGVLRQVPLVSSLVNWFSPPKETTKGRTFNLSSGKILSTENTYKYHMQIQEDGGGNNAVPQLSPRGKDAPKPETVTIKTAGEVKAELINQSAALQSVQTSHSAASQPAQLSQSIPSQQDSSDVGIEIGKDVVAEKPRSAGEAKVVEGESKS